MNHTLGEWRAIGAEKIRIVARQGDGDVDIALAHREDDAAFIASACNTHDALVSALRAALPALIRLGDFIGNGEMEIPASGTAINDRCAIVLEVRNALAEVDKP